MSTTVCHSDPALKHRYLDLAGWAYVAAMLAWVLSNVWPALLIPWWFNTDEAPFFYETVRQLRLDPSQTFFDIPGTPFMTLNSVLTASWWATERLFGLSDAITAADFAFENIQGVYVLMRCITLGCYVMAVGLAYSVFRRVSGALAGAAAAAIMCTLPIHVHYSHFVRTESLGLVLCLGAILLLLHPRTQRRWQAYLAAGAMAGIAMGARFHFALVGLPVLLAFYFLHDRGNLDFNRFPDSPRRVLYVAGAALAAMFISGAVITLLFRMGVLPANSLTHTMLLSTFAGPEQYAGAKRTVAKLWLLLGSISLATAILQLSISTRRWLSPLVNPFTLAMLLGFAGGFLFSHPTFIWRGEHQLKSIQFYADWVDPNLASLGPLGSWWNVTSYYFTTALPELWLQALFVAGTALILLRRKPWSVAFLMGAAMCFVAHPVTMKLWPHHIVPWLPFLAYVAAYPIGLLDATITNRWRQPAVIAVLFLGVLTSLTVALAPRLSKADEYLQISRARTDQIAQMDHWLARNVPVDAYILLSYYALDSDGMFKWLESSGVTVPEFVKRYRNVEIWWLQRSLVDGRTGYLCISQADIAFFHADFERQNPGSTYNPFENENFEELATFGSGFYELKVFKFDFRSTPRS